MSLLNIQDKISQAIENYEYSVGIFLDLSKAFDSVDHKILVKKLDNYWKSRVTTPLVQKLSG